MLYFCYAEISVKNKKEQWFDIPGGAKLIHIHSSPSSYAICAHYSNFLFFPLWHLVQFVHHSSKRTLKRKDRTSIKRRRIKESKSKLYCIELDWFSKVQIVKVKVFGVKSSLLCWFVLKVFIWNFLGILICVENELVILMLVLNIDIVLKVLIWKFLAILMLAARKVDRNGSEEWWERSAEPVLWKFGQKVLEKRPILLD